MVRPLPEAGPGAESVAVGVCNDVDLLVGFLFRLGDALVNGFPSGEAFCLAMPVSDFLLAQFPAQQHCRTIHDAGKIQKSNVEIFDLDTGRMNFSDRVFNPLHGFFALRLASGQMNDLDQSPAIQKNAVSNFLHFEVNFLDELLALDSSAQERFQNRQKGLSLFESKSSVGHKSGHTYSNPLWPITIFAIVRAPTRRIPIFQLAI